MVTAGARIGQSEPYERPASQPGRTAGARVRHDHDRVGGLGLGAVPAPALSTLSSVYQLSLPQWIKARGMSFYLVVFQGGNAVGSAVMGIAAVHAGLTPTLTVAATGLALGPLAGLRWKFRRIAPEDLLPAGDWPAPQLATFTAAPDGTASDGTAPDGTAAPAGPVMVSVEYRARAGQAGELMAALQDTRFSRRRTGASSWRAWQDAADPDRILEQFVVASWTGHLRQHEQVTLRDQARLDRLAAMTDPDHPPAVTHWLTPPRGRPAGHEPPPAP